MEISEISRYVCWWGRVATTKYVPGLIKLLMLTVQKENQYLMTIFALFSLLWCNQAVLFCFGKNHWFSEFNILVQEQLETTVGHTGLLAWYLKGIILTWRLKHSSALFTDSFNPPLFSPPTSTSHSGSMTKSQPPKLLSEAPCPLFLPITSLPLPLTTSDLWSTVGN